MRQALIKYDMVQIWRITFTSCKVKKAKLNLAGSIRIDEFGKRSRPGTMASTFCPVLSAGGKLMEDETITFETLKKAGQLQAELC